MAQETKLMRIGELAEATGVSVQTIHFYLREGLLPPPMKTAPNMAYYNAEYIEDIKLIRDLKEKRYLPLSVIKLVLEARKQGKHPIHVEDMRLSLDRLFRPLGPEEELEPVGLVELVAMTGLPAATVEELEELGLLAPASTPQGKRYDGLNVRIVRAVKKLLEVGLEPSDLDIYRRYAEVLQAEATVVLEKVIHGPGGPKMRGSEIMETLEQLRSAIAAKVQRQVAMDHHRKEVGERQT